MLRLLQTTLLVLVAPVLKCTATGSSTGADPNRPPPQLVWLQGNSTQLGCGLTLATGSSSYRYHSAGQRVLAAVGRVLPPRSPPLKDEEVLRHTPATEPRAGEGLQMTVFNPHTGRVTFKKMFPLGLVFGHYMDLEWHVGRLQEESIVSLLVSVTGIVGLRDTAHTMQRLGSVLATHLPPTANWVWVFVKGGKTIIETGIMKTQKAVWGHAPMFLPPHVKEKHASTLESERWEFCQTEEALGPFCRKDSPADVRPQSASLPYSEILNDIPVLVTGGSRNQYLYETLRSLIAAPGLRRNNLEVILGDTTPATLTLLKMMGVRYVQIPMYGVDNSRLFQFYRAAFQHVADYYQSAPAAIFLDEDVQISPDFFSLMSQMIPLLVLDPSLYCATAHAGGASPSLSGRKDMLKRTASQVLWGYAVTMKFINEALNKWPTDRAYNIIYDLWMYDNVVGSRECVQPEVTRTKHFGAGVNTLGYDLEKFFLPIELVQESGIVISNLNDIPINNWRRHMKTEVMRATPLKGNPCEPGFFTNRPNGTYIFYYLLEVDEKNTYSIDNYFKIGECLNFWAQSDQGWHEALTKLRLTPGVELYLMGVPTSTYSYLAKPGYPPWNSMTLPTAQYAQLERDIRRYYTVRFNVIQNKVDNPVYMEDLFTLRPSSRPTYTAQGHAVIQRPRKKGLRRRVSP